MVTEFPIFSKLSPEDKQFFDKFNAQFPYYADWAFGTLMTWWDAFDDLGVARIGDNLVIKSSYLSMGKTPRLSLLGNVQVDESIQALFSYQKKSGHKPMLYSLPQYTIDAIKHSDAYAITDDPNAAEYVLSTAMHALMNDPSMYAIRRRVAQFGRAVHDHEISATPLALDTLANKMLVINSLHTWHDIYRNDTERLEGTIIDKALLIAEQIDLKCLALFIDKELHGFVLYKHLTGGAIDINHIKVSYAYQGIFSYLLHSVALHVYDQGVPYMNFEQDLGIEGLRFHKTMLRPIHMLRKYNVSPK